LNLCISIQIIQICVAAANHSVNPDELSIDASVWKCQINQYINLSIDLHKYAHLNGHAITFTTHNTTLDKNISQRFERFLDPSTKICKICIESSHVFIGTI